MKKRGAEEEPAPVVTCRRTAFMAGAAEPPEEAKDSAPPASADLTPSKAAVAEKPSKKICHGLDSSEQHVWADLMDSLLHLIILLFSSFHDFLAFTSTCRSWRAVVSSFPPVFHFPFPPLHFKASIRHAHRHVNDGVSWHNPLCNYKWQLRDPAKANLSICCSSPRNSPNYVRYLGCSYGYLIFTAGDYCLLVDVYTSTKVKPPKLRCRDHSEIYYGVLTAPLSSPNSRLLLCFETSMFQWQVGADSWTEHTLVSGYIRQIVSFKGQMFALDSFQKLYTISLAPQLGMQEVQVVWREDIVAGLHKDPWLVVCGDMLLMVDLVRVCISHASICKFCFQAFRLDLSAEPAKWVKVEKLENRALFVSLDMRSSTFSCMSLERWGGKSNCIYVPSRSKDSNEPLIAVELGQFVSSRNHPASYILAHRYNQLESFWVLPSLVYGVTA